MIYSVRRDDLTKKTICDCEAQAELARQQTQKTGKRISQTVQILDFEGFGRSHLWKPGMKPNKIITYNSILG